MITKEEKRTYISDEWFSNDQEKILEWIAPEINAILESISQNLSHLPFLINQQNILHSIFNDVKNLWYPRLERVCILEIQSLKDRNILDSKQDPMIGLIELVKDPRHRNFLLKKYPVLQQKLDKFKKFYLRAIEFFLESLKANSSQIEAHFFEKIPEYKLQSLYFVGDPHNYFNRVILLEFQWGKGTKKLVFKPRSIENEDCYNRFLSELNAYIPLKLKVTHCLTKEKHGYCEFIEQKSCSTEKEVQEFYFRYGMLVAVSYFLNISDIHYENLIANGNQPVLVDLECMGLPVLSNPKSKTHPLNFHKTVLNSGLLPQFEFTEDGCIDISALSGGKAQEAPFQISQLEKDEEGNYSVTSKKATLSDQANRLYHKGKELSAEQYYDQISEGFKSAYSAMMEHKKFFLEKVLPRFTTCQARLVFRSTHIYLTLLKEQYHPSLLYDANKWEEHLSWVKENIFHELDLSESEILQMKNDDVPIYTVSLSDKQIKDSYHYLTQIHLLQTGMQALMNNFLSASKEDLDKQLSMLQFSFIPLELNQKKQSEKKEISSPRHFPEVNSSTDLEKAKTILTHLGSMYHYRGDSFHYWPIHKNQEVQNQNYYYITTTKIDLYDGLTGILLPFLFISTWFGESSFTSFCDQALEEILRLLELHQKLDEADLGLFSGLGGIGYLCHILYSLGQDQWASLIEKKLLQVIEKKLSTWLNLKAGNFDLISGLSGFVLVLDLLKKQKTIEEASHSYYLDICRKFFFDEYLIPSILPENSDTQKIKKPLLGMSHGVSGIAWVLYQVWKEEESTLWIEKALSYERQHYSQKYHNWPNFSKVEGGNLVKENYQTDWCHGAIGIGLNRMHLYHLGFRDGLIEEEIQLAIKHALNYQEKKDINLCHGLLGNHEFLLCAHKYGWTEHENYLSVSKHFEKITKNLNQITTEIFPFLYKPGLMTGYAGIAYQLLRKIAPNKVPSILLLE